MNPLNFPSNRDLSEDLTMSQIEKKYVGRKKKKDPFAFIDSDLLLVLVIVVLVIVCSGLYVIIDRALPTTKAEAAVKTDKELCQEWREGKWTVIGATDEQVAEHCNSL